MRTVAGLAALVLLAGCVGSGQEPPRESLPDLDQALPDAISIETRGGRRVLVFASAVDNVGAGALVIEGSRSSRAVDTMRIRQLVTTADGSTDVRSLPGRLRYVRSETHSHWHLLGFEHYSLRRASDGRLVAPDRKTGFCLGDRYRIASPPPAAPPKAVWVRECGRGRTRLLRLRQGISPGYGDDYVPALEGQLVDLTGVPPGRYLLVHRVNADLSIRESNYENNAASV
ncbi:MAG TPA: lysyl oxidase family protein, partial [Gaiellaceae bacterium]|nr:lysyl oxidase family protein [Gaiellaceae bacterium]